jgi:hypothetical protein
MQDKPLPRMSRRECNIIALATCICNLMQKHKDRAEAIDAYDIARVLFRKGTKEEGFKGRLSMVLPTSHSK